MIVIEVIAAGLLVLAVLLPVVDWLTRAAEEMKEDEEGPEE